MVKHSPIDRLRQLHQQRQVDADVHPEPGQQALPNAGDGTVPPALPPVGEALRTAAQARAEADALEQAAAADAIENADPHLNDLPELHPNVNARRRRIHGEGLAFGAADDLGASFVDDGDDFPDSPPPWLSQVINAAVTAAATAVAAIPQRSSQSSSTRSPMAPTKLSDRKVPDFWESKPEEWFRIFDAHLDFFKPSQDASFNTLLPLLTPAALSKMTPILRVPGLDPYTRAKATLLKHFAKTPRDLARELRELRSLPIIIIISPKMTELRLE